MMSGRAVERVAAHAAVAVPREVGETFLHVGPLPQHGHAVVSDPCAGPAPAATRAPARASTRGSSWSARSRGRVAARSTRHSTVVAARVRAPP